MAKIDFEIDRDETLRYLGYRGRRPDAATEKLLSEIIAGCKAALNPRFIARRCAIEQAEIGVAVKNSGLVMRGQDIKKHLDGCDECYIFCATVGTGADNYIRSMQALSVSRGIVADAAATAAIEAYCDRLERNMRERLKAEGKFLTWRYSPGYGDFPFVQQPEVLSFLQAAKYAGVTYNESYMMIPTKSVSAVMGIANRKPQSRTRSCSTCPNRDNCDFSCRQQ